MSLDGLNPTPHDMRKELRARFVKERAHAMKRRAAREARESAKRALVDAAYAEQLRVQAEAAAEAKRLADAAEAERALRAQVSYEQAVAELWRKGVLIWKVRATQLPVYEFLALEEATQVLAYVHRQFGKSFLAGLIAVEACLRVPKRRVTMVAPTQKMLRAILLPNMATLLEDCPTDLRPQFSALDNVYTFPNGSTIRLDGADGGNLENLRGRANDLVIIDEAGFIRELKALIHDIILPSFLTTNGRLICITTPPKSAGHYCASMRQRLGKVPGGFIKYRLSDNAAITPEVMARWAAEAGGAESPSFRREYECEEITDAEAAVVPEFNEAAKRDIVKVVPPPDQYVPRLTAMDLGWSDPTGVLFSYYDFNSAVLRVQDELLLKKPRIEQIARDVAAKEVELWGATRPYQRISDVDPMVLAELSAEHGLHFRPVTKALKEQMVNELRTWVRGRRIVIDPRCVQLIAQLEAAIWTTTRRSFEHTEAFGHFDLVDALVYQLTALPKHVNPYPVMPVGVNPYTHYIEPGAFPNREAEPLRQLFQPALHWRR